MKRLVIRVTGRSCFNDSFIAFWQIVSCMSPTKKVFQMLTLQKTDLESCTGNLLLLMESVLAIDHLV